MNTCTEERFLKDVAEHQMTVLRDDGVHRHVRFRKPGTGCMGFDLVTWPGYLAYTGDMGCYVFTRLEDMFQFFRTSGHEWKDGRKLRTNRDYWSEKVAAADRDGVTEYSADRFREAIGNWLDSAEASAEVRAAVERDVLPYADEGEPEIRNTVRLFEHEGFRFDDFWEANLHQYTYRFTWCCYALAWAIKQYDDAWANSALAAGGAK